jgi:hypothetical protein
MKIKMYRAIILPAVYVYETFTLREGKLRVFENRVLHRIFGSKREEMTGGQRKLHSEELYV